MRKSLLTLFLLLAWQGLDLHAQRYTESVAFIGKASRNSLGEFGNRVAISGNFAVVSALSDNNDRENIFYVFKHDNRGSWQEVAKLEAPDGHTSDEFSQDVYIDGDVIVIRRNQTFDDSSLGFTYQRQADNSWAFVSLIPNFGVNVSNFNIDMSLDQGKLAMVVNARDFLVLNVFGADNRVDWTVNASMTLGSTYNGFGNVSSMDMDGDMIALGWKNLDLNAGNSSPSGAGVVELYEVKDGTITREEQLVPTPVTQFLNFGKRVSLLGERLAVTADPFQAPGKVFIFEVEADGIWTQAQVLEPAELAEGDDFGEAIEMTDGVLFVGTPSYREAGVNFAEGRVYVYEQNPTTKAWSELEILAPKIAPFGEFGEQISFSEGTLLIGAPETNGNFSNEVRRGEVYAYGECQNGTYEVSDSACIDDSNYEFGGNFFSESGTYTHTFKSVNGCDSTVVLTLEILPSDFVVLPDVLIRPGDSFDFNGQTITETGEYQLELQNRFGCDSIVSQPVIVSNNDFVDLGIAEICEGETYSFGNQTLTTSGVYNQNLTNTIGGDSLVVIQLIVNEADLTVLDPIQICEGTEFSFAGQIITESGLYENQLMNQAGCDSIVQQQVDFLRSDFVVLDPVNICDGDSYNFGDQTITTSGMYQQQLLNILECDSIVQVEVTVRAPDVVTLDDVKICQGESFPFGDQILTTSGTFNQMLTNQFGCDSLVNITIDVLPLPQPLITIDDSNDNNPSLVAEPAGADGYQWIDCATNQPITGATSAIFTPTVFGEYAVEVNVNGCLERSACLSLEVLSVENENEISRRVRLFPNPTANQVTVSLPTVYKQIRASVYNNSGVQQIQAVFENRDEFELSVAQLPQGVYTLRIMADDKVASKRIVKQ